MGIPKSFINYDLNKSRERAIVSNWIFVPLIANINIPS